MKYGIQMAIDGDINVKWYSVGIISRPLILIAKQNLWSGDMEWSSFQKQYSREGALVSRGFKIKPTFYWTFPEWT